MHELIKMSLDEMVALLEKEVERFDGLRKDAEAYSNSLRDQYSLTFKLYDFVGGQTDNPDRKMLEEILETAETDVSGWILDLPFSLASRNMVDEAVEICRKFSELFEKENFSGDLAIIYAEAGRKEDALSQIEVNLSRFPEDAWIVIKAGDALETLKETDRALELYRRAYELTSPRTYDRDGLLERLVPLLRDLNKDHEADSLIEKESISQLRRQEISSNDFFPWTLPLPKKTLKVGRNEPCPCGSGKKYKKCCGK